MSQSLLVGCHMGDIGSHFGADQFTIKTTSVLSYQIWRRSALAECDHTCVCSNTWQQRTRLNNTRFPRRPTNNVNLCLYPTHLKNLQLSPAPKSLFKECHHPGARFCWRSISCYTLLPATPVYVLSGTLQPLTPHHTSKTGEVKQTPTIPPAAVRLSNISVGPSFIYFQYFDLWRLFCRRCLSAKLSGRIQQHGPRPRPSHAGADLFYRKKLLFL